MPDPPFEFSLASWNVHLGIHNDGGRNDIVSQCRSLDADVLVLQEAWWYDEHDSELVPSVAAALGYELFWYIAGRPVAGAGETRTPWSIAVMTRLDARRLDDRPLPTVGEQPRHVMVRIELVDAGVTLAGCHLYGVHALVRRPLLWLRERRALRTASDDDHIIVGDMNMWGPVVDQAAGRLRRAVRGRTWPSSFPHSQIDHILVSPRVEVVSSKVCDDMGSDHRAVRAVLRS